MGASTATQPAAATQPSQTQKRELTASQKIFLEDPEVRNEMLLEAFKERQYKQCVDLCNLLSLEERKSLSGDARKAVAKAAMALDNPGQNRSGEREEAMRGRDGRRATPSQHFPEQAEPEVAKPPQGTNPNGHLGEQQAPAVAKPRQERRPGQTSPNDGVWVYKDGEPIYKPDALKRIHAAEMETLKRELKLDDKKIAELERKAAPAVRAERDKYNKERGITGWTSSDADKAAKDVLEKEVRARYGLGPLDELKAKQQLEEMDNENRRKAEGLRTDLEKMGDGVEKGGKVFQEVHRKSGGIVPDVRNFIPGGRFIPKR